MRGPDLVTALLTASAMQAGTEEGGALLSGIADAAAVRVELENELDRGLPEFRYDADLFHARADAVFGHVHDSYFGAGKSIYSAVA